MGMFHFSRQETLDSIDHAAHRIRRTQRTITLSIFVMLSVLTASSWIATHDPGLFATVTLAVSALAFSGLLVCSAQLSNRHNKLMIWRDYAQKAPSWMFDRERPL